MIHSLVVDTSALMALLVQEPEAQGSRFHSTSSEIEALLSNLRVQVLPFDAHHLNWAMHGWCHYGQGRHKAALNLGACFGYGLAKALSAPLLFTGEDFPHTDVKVAR